MTRGGSHCPKHTKNKLRIGNVMRCITLPPMCLYTGLTPGSRNKAEQGVARFRRIGLFFGEIYTPHNSHCLDHIRHLLKHGVRSGIHIRRIM